jgi:type II secretory pathway pseudopilin PulG
MGMLMKKNRTRCGGFLWAELVVAIGLLGVVVAGLAVSMTGFTLVNNCQWTRQRCTAAAQAQLDSLVATGRPIEPQELQRLWPRVEVQVDRSPGTGPWNGLDLLQVTATAQAGRRKITVHLARYVGRASPLATQGRAETHDLPSAPAEGGQS